MPLLVDAALVAKQLGISPSELGFNLQDAGVSRSMAVALNLYEIASDRKRTAKVSEWDKANPDLKRMLDRVKYFDRSNATATVDDLSVNVELPERK